MGDRLKKRGDIWYAWVRGADGTDRLRSTHCTDKVAARIEQARLERDAVDPARAAANQTTLQRVLDDYEASRRRLKRAEGTLQFVRTKSGHLLRLLSPLARDITHGTLEKYIDARSLEGAENTTIKKEIGVLGGAWKLARRNRLVLTPLDELMPELEDDYEPRDRALTLEELFKLCLALPMKRAAVVTFIVATSAEWGAVGRAELVDVAADFSMCHVRGTKRKTRNRQTPVVADVQRSLLAFAVRHADGVEGKLFSRWSNVGRDLKEACELAEIPKCSPNDLRRTFGTWLREAGVEPQLIGAAMGHVDSRMVEKVYGRLTPEALSKLLAERLQKPVRLMSGGEAKTGSTATEPDTEEPPQPEDSARFVGAQRRNRTADTGIFNPSRTTRNAQESDVFSEERSVGVRRPAAVAGNKGSPRSASDDDTGTALDGRLGPSLHRAKEAALAGDETACHAELHRAARLLGAGPSATRGRCVVSHCQKFDARNRCKPFDCRCGCPGCYEARRALAIANRDELVADADHWNRTHPNEEPFDLAEIARPIDEVLAACDAKQKARLS